MLNPFGYRGYCYDADMGLYYLQSRYYDPNTGRFINADDTNYLNATGTVLGCNLFAYCENDPVNKVDPKGTVAANIVGAVIGAIIGVVGGTFLGNWLADRLGLSGKPRTAFVVGIAALTGATVAAIGSFIGPYVAKIAVKLAHYMLNLLQKGKLVFQKLSKSAKIAVRTLGKSACFVEGTPVLGKDGKIPIEKISEGDLVWSKNQVTGESGFKRVTKVFVRKTKILVTVSTETQNIITTEEHPFWVVSSGWSTAASLKNGDYLLLSNGETTKILDVQIEQLEAFTTVYNLEIEDWHTYFVGEQPVLVHNQCARDFAKAARKGKDVIKYLKKNGFKVVIQNGSHVKLTDGLRTLTVPIHGSKDIGKGLLIEILKQAGLW